MNIITDSVVLSRNGDGISITAQGGDGGTAGNVSSGGALGIFAESIGGNWLRSIGKDVITSDCRPRRSST